MHVCAQRETEADRPTDRQIDGEAHKHIVRAVEQHLYVCGAWSTRTHPGCVCVCECLCVHACMHACMYLSIMHVTMHAGMIVCRHVGIYVRTDGCMDGWKLWLEPTKTLHLVVDRGA